VRRSRAHDPSLSATPLPHCSATTAREEIQREEVQHKEEEECEEVQREEELREEEQRPNGGAYSSDASPDPAFPLP
jgi:hypothetical protein